MLSVAAMCSSSVGRTALVAMLLMGTAALPNCDLSSQATESKRVESQPTIQVMGDPARSYGVGERAEARDFAMSYAETSQCRVEQHLRPRQGWSKLGVRVTLEGTSEREVPVNPFYASLEAKNGNTYRATLAGCRPQLAAQRIVQGQKATGWISFDVPKDMREFTLSYHPTVIGSGPQEVKFKLSL